MAGGGSTATAVEERLQVRGPWLAFLQRWKCLRLARCPLLGGIDLAALPLTLALQGGGARSATELARQLQCLAYVSLACHSLVSGIAQAQHASETLGAMVDDARRLLSAARGLAWGPPGQALLTAGPILQLDSTLAPCGHLHALAADA